MAKSIQNRREESDEMCIRDSYIAFYISFSYLIIKFLYYSFNILIQLNIPISFFVVSPIPFPFYLDVL